ncbi:MAG: hypothetical protein ACLPXT_13135 [Terracidiphilus sp.]
MKIFSGYLLHTPKRFAEASWDSQPSKFQILRAMSMTNNERIPEAIPHQGARTLSSRNRFFLTRGNKTFVQIRREKTRTWRFRHGVARAFENLRGVRLSLVPRPNPRECVLQGM